MLLRRVALPLLAALLLLVAGCSDDDSSSSTTTKPDRVEPLQILVSNDDGYQAEGIDVLVEGLAGLEDVEIVVYAPLDQRSGSGGKSTDGETAVTDVTLASGHEAKAVDGFPADSVRVALEDDGIEPDLVVTGINEGQNVGPAIDLSGTIGAARVAVAHDIPALAVSSGTSGFDYEAAVPLVLDWIRDHRDALLDGSAADEVTNLNVPSCSTGMIRGLAEVEPDLTGDLARALGVQDCSSTDAVTPQELDVDAFLAGYATISVVPAEPATPAEVVPAGQ